MHIAPNHKLKKRFHVSFVNWTLITLCIYNIFYIFTIFLFIDNCSKYPDRHHTIANQNYIDFLSQPISVGVYILIFVRLICVYNEVIYSHKNEIMGTWKDGSAVKGTFVLFLQLTQVDFSAPM